MLDDLLQLLHGAVEPLDVPHVQDGAAAPRDREQLAGLFDGGRDRLLDQDADTGLQQVGRDREVLLGGYRDADDVDQADQVAMVDERAGVVGSRDLGRARPVDVDDAGQLDVPQLRVREQVILPHVARAHHAGP